MSREETMNRAEWAQAFLTECGFPFTTENVLAMVAWMTSENTGSRWNPLATTQNMPGATTYNSANVRNFPSLPVGLEANRITLFNGYYRPIIAALQQGDSADRTCAAISASPWGSHPSPTILATVRARPASYAAMLIPGSKAGPPPPPIQEAPAVTDNTQHLAAPIVGMCVHPSGDGYWLVGADGGVFNFGNVPQLHPLSSDGIHTNHPISGCVAHPNGKGFYMWSGIDGGVFARGDVPEYGSIPGDGIDAFRG